MSMRGMSRRKFACLRGKGWYVWFRFETDLGDG